MATSGNSALADFTRIEIAQADDALYARFRGREPQLVSCLDADNGSRSKRPKRLAAHIDGTPAGVASWVAFRNDCRKQKANLYARVDLVIVSSAFRGLGIARLLTISTLLHKIETH